MVWAEKVTDIECDGCDAGGRCVYVGSLCNPTTAASNDLGGYEAAKQRNEPSLVLTPISARLILALLGEGGAIKGTEHGTGLDAYNLKQDLRALAAQAKESE